MVSVNIVTSDRGWILERLASEITSRLDYVRHTDVPDPGADINYYITYSCWSGRVSRIEVAWFAHLEPLGEAHDKFFASAAAMDHCLTQARLYEDILQQRGISRVTTISPGVDLDLFKPKLSVGVIGRAYHTGRKGEALVAQLIDMPEVDWHFTGTGWPGPALELSDKELPAFYRGLDYVLVPSLYEGGPMCVVEALASGTEVISSPVGWVPDFPHIEFKTGDVDDLRRVLLNLFAKKQKLRESVVDRTWENWAARHHELFQDLAALHPEQGTVGGWAASSRAAHVPIGRAGLLMHGNEASSQGGPSVRVPRTARELNKIGARAEALTFQDTNLDRFDLVHTFNVWAPQSALRALRQAKRHNKVSIFSPIFLDLSERPLFDRELLDVFRHTTQVEAIDERLAELMRRWDPVRQDPARADEAMGGYFAMVRQMVAMADHLVLLSEKERQLLTAIGAELKKFSIVHNPTDSAAFKAVDPALFLDTYELKDFVLCVGRVEARKNQLMLAHALRDMGIPLVLIGHTPSKEYRDLIERHGGGSVHFLGRLQAGSDLLLSAFRAARVVTLPSWSEGAPLAALEAGAAGARLVLSDRSSELEYFGSFARYVNPADPQSIRNAILEAFESSRTAEMRAAQIEHMERSFSWTNYTQNTRLAYEIATTSKARTPAVAAPPALRIERAPRPVLNMLYDVTTTVNRRGRITGIARVEYALALELAARADINIRFVCWDNKNRQFSEIPLSALRDGALEQFREPELGTVPAEVWMDPGALFVVAGSGWMQNAVYAEGVVAYAQHMKAQLAIIVHDLIPVLFPHWFDDEYVPVFERNMRVMLSNADRIIAISETTKQDVKAILRRQLDTDADVITFREGDQIGYHETQQADGGVPPELERFASTSFVIAVGAIHVRKNYRILYDVWVRLAEQLGGHCPTLLLIGGVAWNGTELARSIKGDKRLHGKIVVLDHVDDIGLDWLYRNCIFTVYPSLYEGWGLPVCESLRYGKICVASNAASIQEIAPDVTDLLDPLDFTAWYARIRFYATSERARQDREAVVRKGYRLTPWSTAAGELALKLRAPAGLNLDKARYYLGAMINFAAGNNMRRHARGPWHISESWGAWSSGRTIGLEFHLPTPPVDDLVFAAKVKALPVAGAQLDVDVLVNGIKVIAWSFQNQIPQIRSLTIESKSVGADGMLRLEFTNSDVFAIAEAKEATGDRRAVGIGFAAAILTEAVRADKLRATLDPKNECGEAVLPGEYLSLLNGRRSARMLSGAWQKSSAWGLWTEGADARLYVDFDWVRPRTAKLRFTVRAAASAEQPLLVAVFANSVEVAIWEVQNAELHEVDLVVPPAIQAIRQPLALTFVPRERSSPSQRGVGREKQEISIGLFDMLETSDDLTVTHVSNLPVVQIGERVAFSVGSASRSETPISSFLQRGWYGPEKSGVWSRGTRGELAFRLDRMPSSGVFALFQCRAFAAESGQPVCLRFEVNGRSIVERVLPDTQPTPILLYLDKTSVGDDRVVRLSIACDRARAPSSMGQSADDRLLGFQIKELEVESGLMIRPFRRYEVGRQSEITEAFVGGWHAPEPSGRWSNADGGRIRCGLDADGAKEIALHASARVFGSFAEGVVLVDVLSQGELLTTLSFLSDDIQEVVLAVPLKSVASVPFLDLTFKRHGSLVPASVGVREDDRDLGLWLGSIELLLSKAERISVDRSLDLMDATASGALVGTWLKSPGWGTWPTGPSCSLVVIIDGDADALEFTLRACATTEHPVNVTVLINGNDAGVWFLDRSDLQTCSVPLPAKLHSERPLEVCFANAEPGHSPLDLKLGREARALAFGLYEIRAVPPHGTHLRASSVAPVLVLGEDLVFKRGAPSRAGVSVEAFLASGWFGTESFGVWSRGRIGRLLFRFDPVPRGALMLAFTLRVMASRAKPANVSVLVNGIAVLALMIVDGAPQDLVAEIAPVLLNGRGLVAVDFQTDQVIAPSSNGRAGDDRLLGLQLSRIKVTPAGRLQIGGTYGGSGQQMLVDFCVEGWYEPEDVGIWSGEYGRVSAELSGSHQGAVMLTVTIRVFGTEHTGPAVVEIVDGDGAVVTVWTFCTDDIETRVTDLPLRSGQSTTAVDFSFRRKGAVSPATLGQDDGRILGVWISSLQISQHLHLEKLV